MVLSLFCFELSELMSRYGYFQWVEIENMVYNLEKRCKYLTLSYNVLFDRKIIILYLVQ